MEIQPTGRNFDPARGELHPAEGLYGKDRGTSDCIRQPRLYTTRSYAHVLSHRGYRAVTAGVLIDLPAATAKPLNRQLWPVNKQVKVADSTVADSWIVEMCDIVFLAAGHFKRIIPKAWRV